MLLNQLTRAADLTDVVAGRWSRRRGWTVCKSVFEKGPRVDVTVPVL
jgi:hypothetical protein